MKSGTVMKLQRVYVSKPAGKIPAFQTIPEHPIGGAVLIPPYGSTKEQMLGIATCLAEEGWASLSIDLCGHGENTTHIGPGEMLGEVAAALDHVRHFGRTVAAGISLGGRLALMSSADQMIAISPAVVAEISERGRWMFENFPSPGVREPYAGYVVQLLEQMGPVPRHSRPCLILYAERDIPAILEGAGELKAKLSNAEVRYVTEDLRPEVQHENGFIRYLPRWFNHGELKFNSQVMRMTAEWLRQPHVAPAVATA